MIPDGEQTTTTYRTDRSARIYFGMEHRVRDASHLRRRIHWMAEQVVGPRVLDVGCSDGVLEILLARRGLEVVGIDVDARALEYARCLLAREHCEVNARVRLIQGDLTRSIVAMESFNTVVVGEILRIAENPAYST